ncbi:MAG: CinA family protein [Demequina sp.]
MPRPDPTHVIDAARAVGLTIATAESLTGGALCHLLVSVPGASDVVRGAVVAYAPELKQSLLGVSPEVVRVDGTVSAAAAEAMAQGACAVTGSSVGVATTGVAGPGTLEGKPAGRVHIGLAISGDVTSERFDFAGDRATVVQSTCDAALTMLARAIIVGTQGA